MKLLIVLLGAVLAACSDSGARQQEKKAAQEAAPAAVPVSILEMTPRAVPVSFEAVARTDFDVRGHMMTDAPTSAFQKVTISISVVSDAPEDKLKEVERLSFEGCPGINTLREPVPVETRLTVTRTQAEQAA
jgi:uncharacterized OsmC-like protein